MSNYVLETKGLGISFGGLKAVSDVNLKIKKGEIYGLIGPNGAGKTTILRSIIRQLEPLGGVAYLDGQDVQKLSGQSVRSVCECRQLACGQKCRSGYSVESQVNRECVLVGVLQQDRLGPSP